MNIKLRRDKVCEVLLNSMSCGLATPEDAKAVFKILKVMLKSGRVFTHEEQDRKILTKFKKFTH